jgi:hypothetical protein
MVRTLTAPRASRGQRTVLLPGTTEAEPWEVWTTGEGAACLQACQRLQDNSAGNETVLALPVAQVVALPLWLRETDPKQFREMIRLQLEARGLQPRAGEAIFEWSLVAQDEARTLVLAAVLANLLPEEIETDIFPIFELSARCFTMPTDALVIWMEQGRLVVAATRGCQVAYFQTLSAAGLTVRAIQDLTCVATALQMQKVLGDIKKIVAWTTLTPIEIAALQAALGVPVRQEPKPAPELPRQAWNLIPRRVDDAKRQRTTRRWQSLAVLIAVVLGLGFVVALGLRLFFTSREIADLQQWQAAHAASLQTISDTHAAWHDLQPVVDTEGYPLEVLLRVAGSLPADQVHLTLFDEEGDHLLIKAEAKNLTSGFQFFDQVKKNPKLKGYTWEMAQPHSLANDVTQLQIEGTRAIDD